MRTRLTTAPHLMHAYIKLAYIVYKLISIDISCWKIKEECIEYDCYGLTTLVSIFTCQCLFFFATCTLTV